MFVGYGIHAPEYQWDDYAGVDLKGKVALVIVNEPPSEDEKFFKGKAMTYYGRWTYKYEEAARRGAVGVLIIHRTDLASYGWEVVRNSQAIEKSYLQGDPDATLRAAAWIQHDVAQKLLTAAGLGDVDEAIAKAGKRGFQAVELPVHLKGHVESRVRRYDSTNVVGARGGRRIRRAMRCCTPRTTTTSASIPTPRATTSITARPTTAPAAGFFWRWRAPLRSPRRSRRTMCISLPSRRRSRGCWGRSISACIRRCRPRQITLDLNYDMVLPIGMPRSVNLGGAERIDFWPTVQKVAKAFDLELLPDPTPGAGHYYRSDHFSLARVGIPAFSVDQGELFEGHDEAWGHAQYEDYVAHHYHQPSDEYRADWDFPRQRQAGAIRICAGLAGERTGQAGRVEGRRRIRGGAEEEREKQGIGDKEKGIAGWACTSLKKKFGRFSPTKR